MIINALGRTTAQKRWTQGAIDCYERGMNCQGCIYQDFFTNKNQKCMMKATVLELVRVLGKPESIESKGVIE